MIGRANVLHAGNDVAVVACGIMVHEALKAAEALAAEVLGERCPAPMERVGVQDAFGEVGTVEYLMRKFGLTAGDICAKARQAYARREKACG
jgi:transketolase